MENGKPADVRNESGDLPVSDFRFPVSGFPFSFYR